MVFAGEEEDWGATSRSDGRLLFQVTGRLGKGGMLCEGKGGGQQLCLLRCNGSFVGIILMI